MTHQIITRAAAKALGLKRYRTGKPCPKNHFSERTTRDGSCCECRNEFMRARQTMPHVREADRLRQAARRRTKGVAEKGGTKHSTLSTPPVVEEAQAERNVQPISSTPHITRDDAISRRLTQYFVGQECLHGHIAPRNTKTRQCLECISERNRTRRPGYAELLVSKERGEPFYNGAACAKCNGTKRHVSNGKCVSCKVDIQENAIEASARAIRALTTKASRGAALDRMKNVNYRTCMIVTPRLNSMTARRTVQ